MASGWLQWKDPYELHVFLRAIGLNVVWRGFGLVAK